MGVEKSTSGTSFLLLKGEQVTASVALTSFRGDLSWLLRGRGFSVSKHSEGCILAWALTLLLVRALDMARNIR